MTDIVEETIDVRTIPKPQRHPLIIDAYRRLGLGRGMVLINDHEPTNLKLEMEAEFAGALSWEKLPGDEEADFRVRISRVASTATPRVVADSRKIAALADASGSIWALKPRDRDLDAGVFALTGNEEIREHMGPDHGVLIHVLAGSGTLTTETEDIALETGLIVWLPARSRRRFLAGPDGLRYFTVNKYQEGLSLSALMSSR